MKQIMVVEDNAGNLDVVTRFLVRSNFEVLVPNNAKETIAMAMERPPDAILMDLGLNEWNPPADGYALTTELRKIPELKTVPIIAFSAATFDHHKEKAQAVGCNEFIEKPVDYIKLIARLKEITGVST
ncbi:MAG TPA: response regulator [Planctomycetes bacterium]|nr:response regulator [Fuerstiella sp.]HIK92179.1 response regulator [Planctomycetota bacterium]